MSYLNIISLMSGDGINSPLQCVISFIRTIEESFGVGDPGWILFGELKVANKLYLCMFRQHTFTVWLMLVDSFPAEILATAPPPVGSVSFQAQRWHGAFIRYYRKVRSSICISLKPYNGKRHTERRLQWQVHNISTQHHLYFSIGNISVRAHPYGGRMNCTEWCNIRAHEHCIDLDQWKHKSKEGTRGSVGFSDTSGKMSLHQI